MSHNALNISWAFGFSKDVIDGTHSLSTDERNAIFFLSSHSAVIYDFEHRTQLLLQGHCNRISCCAISNDKRWIATSDVGDDSILVVWDSMTGAPVKTIFNPHPQGAVSIDFSSDSLFIVSVSAAAGSSQQELALWAWTNEDDAPILRQTIHHSDPQHIVKFDPKFQSSIVTTGSSSVIFWTWKDFSCEGFSARVSKSEFGFFSGKFTSTLYLSGTGNAITSTSDGYVIFWESRASQGDKHSHGQTHKSILSHSPVHAASKVLRLVECGISTMVTTPNGYLAIACQDGAVRFYDFYLRLEAWFEDMNAGPITSLSMGTMSNPYGEGEAGAPGLRFWVPDFIVGTLSALIVLVQSEIFDEIRKEDRSGTLLLQGIAQTVSSVACHPFKSLVTFACTDGTLQVWDYELKLLLNYREFNDAAAALAAANARSYGSSRKVVEKAPLIPQCATYCSTGDLLVVGFTNGLVKFLNSETYEDVTSLSPSTDNIVSMRSSTSGVFLAGYDSKSHVFLFKR